MVYLQITTRCNMLCPHCGFTCTANGRGIEYSSFKHAIWLLNKIKIPEITLGGGEPTIHLKFFDILNYSLDNFAGKIGVITNGKDSFSALKLLDSWKKYKSKLRIGLSTDYHDSICDYVYSKYKKYNLIHRISRIANAGRAKKYIKKEEKVNNVCLCGPIITPNGNIRQCSCGNSPIAGNVSLDNRKKLLKLEEILKYKQCINGYE
jgi:MoaA/NifB/PqqE/SkfB family radical SAM enzyme